MPTYEYVCTECGYEFEVMQKITDPPKKRCPQCRHKVQRKFGAGAGLLFKGSGFYTTDYRSSDYRAREKAEKGGAVETGGGKDSAKSDSGSGGVAGAAGGAKNEGAKSAPAAPDAAGKKAKGK